MDSVAKQQGFDTTVALFAEELVSKSPSFSLLVKVADVESLIERFDDLKKTLKKIKEHARANSYSENTRVRIGAFRSTSKNPTMRGGVKVVDDQKEKAPKPASRKKASAAKPSTRNRILNVMCQLKRGITSAELIERLNEPSGSIYSTLKTMHEDKVVKRRKPKKNEMFSSMSRFVYEVSP